LDEENHDVTILDLNANQFKRFLPESFSGRKITGNAVDQDVLRRAGIEEADAFVALTQGDNRNITASQVAKHIFDVQRVVCRIKDPIREEMYNELGLRTVSPTRIGLTQVWEELGA
jgi:trk system potassium uptake protein TrkA